MLLALPHHRHLVADALPVALDGDHGRIVFPAQFDKLIEPDRYPGDREVLRPVNAAVRMRTHSSRIAASLWRETRAST